jgi:hypothetical protein
VNNAGWVEPFAKLIIVANAQGFSIRASRNASSSDAAIDLIGSLFARLTIVISTTITDCGRPKSIFSKSSLRGASD